MDTVTHALLGLATYGAVNKTKMAPPMKRSLLVAAVAGSQVPDLDVFVQMTETGRIMYQMWHRGITHSIFIAPLWACLIYAVCYLIWKRKDRIIFYLALVNVYLHIGLDSLNAWGTGILEPFSSMRATIGIIPIIDFIILGILLVGYILTRLSKSYPHHRVYRGVWCAIVLYVIIQGTQGYIIHQEAKAHYDEVALSASFVPLHFTVIGKIDHVVEISDRTVWQEKTVRETLYSSQDADLQLLFDQNPRAEVLKQWAPFVVIVDDGKHLGILDPRFYYSDQSFLYEYIDAPF